MAGFRSAPNHRLTKPYGRELFIAKMRFELSDARFDGSEVRSMVLCTPLHITISQLQNKGQLFFGSHIGKEKKGAQIKEVHFGN